ncbi:hypothetical protein Pelo_9883 [Pelomyxa schiedti]|nr:hypothetical protein Pelo_9883 [Pelomyxa schiedti]
MCFVHSAPLPFPFFFTCYYCRGHAYLAYILIKQYNAYVDARDDRLDTPLVAAIDRGQFAVVKVLIQNCNANPMLRDEYGETPREIAVRTKHHDIAVFLEGCHYCSTNKKKISLEELITIPASGQEVDDKLKLQLELTKQSSPLEGQQDIFGEAPKTLENMRSHTIRLTIREDNHQDTLNYVNLQTSSLAIRLVCAGRACSGSHLLSGKDCIACNQVCTMWRKALSTDDSIWVPHIKQAISNALWNTIEYHDQVIPQEEKGEWRDVSFWSSKKDVLQAWSATPPEKFYHNSKVKYLWVMRKKGRVPLPAGDVPRYNPLIHNKWWSPRDAALCFWCYIWQYQWLGFFIKQSVSMRSSYDPKVLKSVRNSVGAIGVMITLLVLGKYLSLPRSETDNNCSLWPISQNYIATSVLFSQQLSWILYAFSLGAKKRNAFYWFPWFILILGMIPFPSEWVCFFRSITHPNPIFLAMASCVLLASALLLCKYKLHKPVNLNSLGLGILATSIGLIIWYDRFVIVARCTCTAQLMLRGAYPDYDLTWGRHKLAMAAFALVILALLVLFFV